MRIMLKNADNYSKITTPIFIVSKYDKIMIYIFYEMT
jgi:hypothetical protein